MENFTYTLYYTLYMIRGRRHRRKCGAFCLEKIKMGNANARYKNGARRRKMRARFKAMGLPCAICGREIHYDEPSDAKHPWSFVIDEKAPVSRWREFGYASASEAALDWNNCQAVHYACNARKGARTMEELRTQRRSIVNLPDGEW